jgi:hypothetical protein
MIYVLLEMTDDYEGNDTMVFSSRSKPVVEKKHAEILEHNKKMKAISIRLSDAIEDFSKTLPALVEPKYSELPPRPLVWKDTNWENAYRIDYLKEYANRIGELSAFRDKTIGEYAMYYDVPEDDLQENWYWYLTDNEYAIQEVESD